MYYCDYHLHSEFSADAHEKIENLCKAAVKQGVAEIAITDHVEFGVHETNDWPDFERRRQAIEECRERFAGQLVLLSGLEMGQSYLEREAEQDVLKRDRFDFIIGSLHVLPGIGRIGKLDYENGDIEKYIRVYLDESKKLAQNGDFDVMGHINFLFRYIPKEKQKQFDACNYKKDYEELFEILISREKGIEINTSGCRTILEAPMPSLEMIKWYRECGGKIVTVGSDGHSLRSAYAGLERGYKEAREAGFEKTAIFRERRLVI